MTAHGCAEKAVNLLKEKLNTEVTTINLESAEVPDLSSFNCVIIGGSVRIGFIQKRIRKYCEKNLEVLLIKKVGLFICCMFEGETAMDQLKKNFPEVLWQHASALGLFGGELEFDRLTTFERMLVQQVAGITLDVSKFNEKAIKEFTDRIEKGW